MPQAAHSPSENNVAKEESTKHVNSITKNKLRNFFSQSRGKLVIAGVAALAVVGVGYFIIATHASGFFAATDASQGTLTANAHLVNDSGASGGKAVQFTATVVTPPPT